MRVSLTKGFVYETSYAYTDKHRNRKKAKVQVGCVDGLSPLDELFLWGLLGLAFSQPEPSPDFYATPYWILRQLGKITPTKKGIRWGRLVISSSTVSPSRVGAKRRTWISRAASSSPKSLQIMIVC